MHPLQQIKRSDWPTLIADIAEVIGDEAALNLFIRFAGRSLSVPQSCPPDHVIVLTIGEVKAALFCEAFRGECLVIPNGGKLLIKERNQAILKDYRDGMMQGDIATKYRLTTRQIINIINNSHHL